MRSMLSVLATLLIVTPLCAQSLPSYFPLPAGAEVTNVETANFSEAEFVVPNSDQPVVQRGKSWNADIRLPNMAEETQQPQVWAHLKPVLTNAGWAQVFAGNANPMTATLRYQKAGANAWASIDIYNARDVRISIIEVGKLASAFALRRPAAKPETVSADTGDFPYLPPLAGSTQQSSSADDAPMLIRLPGQDEDQVVASGSIVKSYQAPEGLSNLAFATMYEQALTQAGWNIVESSHGLHQTDVAMTAHYARDGRNLWSLLHFSGGEYSIRVADAGAQQLAAELAKKCHVPVYGVLFDFDKATLRPDSEPQLQKVHDLLTADPSLKLIVEGHTDNVGTPAHNQALSDQRAASVVKWLVGHGVAAERVSSKGYGATKPVASNEDAAGRARNRRVELRKQGCNG